MYEKLTDDGQRTRSDEKYSLRSFGPDEQKIQFEYGFAQVRNTRQVSCEKESAWTIKVTNNVLYHGILFFVSGMNCIAIFVKYCPPIEKYSQQLL